MRVRVTVLVAALVACACAVMPSIAAAHGPIRDRALTIHNSPQSIVAGDPVLIYGRLLGRESLRMLATVQPWVFARSSDFSAPAV